MRKVKPVEVRKKEILEAAVIVFKEKGYDKTSISDIAKSIGISQGLCYRYFKSKEEIFDSAVDSYAQFIADKIIRILEDQSISLIEKISYLPNFTNIEKESSYYKMFHGQGTTSFHDRLSLEICKKVVPQVQKLLNEQLAKEHLKLDDPETTASFLVFGQLGILLDSKIPGEEKNKRIVQFLMKILKEMEC